MLVDAWGGVGAAAEAGGDLATLPVAEEFLPFGVGGDAVLLAWAQGPSAAEEGQVSLDGLLGIDGLVAQGDVDVAMACDDLGDMRWQAVHDGVGDEDSPEIVGRVVQGLPVSRVFQSGVDKRGVEHGPQRAVADRPDLAGEPPLEQDRGRWTPYALITVVDRDERHCSVRLTDPSDDRRQHVRQLWGDDQEPLLICLRGDDLQQGTISPVVGRRYWIRL
jgi:hypothetical protein